LSPMQLRMLHRRSRNGSMTVVGDIAQATGAALPSGWDEVLEHLPSWKGQKVAELSVNYRTPTEVMELAGKILREVAPHLRPPRSVRSTGIPPRFVRVSSDELVDNVAQVARDEIVVGKVAVVAEQSILDAVGERLTAMQVDHSDSMASDVTLVSLSMVKGLEFDSVVVVEPADVEQTYGLRSLYVALTRATQHLTIVHSKALPSALT
ncbi:MAG: ATP-binding domain-containing protein, partial [Actinomycetota bacterium]